MANEVEITLKVVDEASDEIKELTKNTEEMRKSF